MRIMLVTSLLVLVAACIDPDGLKHCYPGDEVRFAGCRIAEVSDMASDGGSHLPDAWAGLDFAGVNGCANPTGSFQPDPSIPMWGCPGAFPTGQIRKRCAAGFSLCKQMNLPEQVCRVNNPSSYAWPGFYAGDERISSSQPMFPVGTNGACDWVSRSRAIGGCGSSFSAISNMVPCRKFGMHMVCSQNNQPGNGAWDCSTLVYETDFDKLTNTRALDGVLCCPEFQ